MKRKMPKRDPVGARRRAISAARRAGIESRCSCGEARPEALITGSKPTTCAACKRAKKGQTPMDSHHFAGKANRPIALPVPVNDHRACFSPAQADWPKSTLRNVQGSPLLAAAACIRGFVDVIFYLIEKGLFWVAEMLERLDEHLAMKLGSRWWDGTEIEPFAPKKRSNG